MAEVAKLTAKLDADTKKFNRDMGKARKSLGGLETSTKKASKGLGQMSTAMKVMGGAAVAGLLIKGIKASIDRAEEMSSAYAITAQVIEQTGAAANVTAGHVKEMAREMAFTTGLDKAVLNNAANVLLTFKEIKNVAGENNKIFDRALTVTTDMATVFGGSAVDAAKQLGKALNDPVLGVTALSRVGVQFTDVQKDQIKAMVEANDVLGAQQIILQEIEGQVGGTAAASADASDKMKVAWNEILEVVGTELLPVMEDFANATLTVVKKIDMMKLGFGQLQDVAREGVSFLGFDVDDAADSMFEFSKRSRFAMDQIRDGRKPIQVAADLMGALAKEGAVTADVIEAVGNVTGVTAGEMGKALQFIAANRDAYGLTAEQAQAAAENTAFFGREAEKVPDNVADWIERQGLLNSEIGTMNDEIDNTPSLLSDYRAALSETVGAVAAAARSDAFAAFALASKSLFGVPAAIQAARDAAAAALAGGGRGGAAGHAGLGTGTGGFNKASGGVVAGPLGKPQFGVLHGGEEVLTASQRVERNVTVNMNGNLTTSGMLQEELSLGLLMAGVNSQAEFSGLADIRG